MAFKGERKGMNNSSVKQVLYYIFYLKFNEITHLNNKGRFDGNGINFNQSMNLWSFNIEHVCAALRCISLKQIFTDNKHNATIKVDPSCGNQRE